MTRRTLWQRCEDKIILMLIGLVVMRIDLILIYFV